MLALKAPIAGDPVVKVNGFSKIEEGQPGTITFLANLKYEKFIYQTKASIVLVNNDFNPTASIEATLIKVPNAYASLAKLMELAEQSKVRKSGINSTAHIATTASVADDCFVGAFAYIGESSKVGKGSKIFAHVYVGDNVTIGDHVILYPNTVVYDGKDRQ